MNSDLNYFPNWRKDICDKNTAYRFLRDDYIIVVNMYAKIKEDEYSFRHDYITKKKLFKKSKFWDKKKRYNDAISSLKELSEIENKIKRFEKQLGYLLERKESIEKNG